MGGKVLDVQKAHLVELIQAAEKVVEEEKSDEYYDNTQILLKAIKVGEAAIELRDSCSEAEEVYERRFVRNPEFPPPTADCTIWNASLECPVRAQRFSLCAFDQPVASSPLSSHGGGENYKG